MTLPTMLLAKRRCLGLYTSPIQAATLLVPYFERYFDLLDQFSPALSFLAMPTIPISIQAYFARVAAATLLVARLARSPSPVLSSIALGGPGLGPGCCHTNCDNDNEDQGLCPGFSQGCARVWLPRARSALRSALE
jgi:hypothetical protein